MSTPTIPDLPDVDPKNPDSLRRFMGALKEIVQTREGRRGQRLDKAVTFRDLQGIGIVQQQPNTGGFVPGPATGGGGGTGGSGSTDLSPAPAVDLASVSVTAGFASIFIEWAAQTYTTGGGNAYTEVWAATYSGSGPLPTFADAKLVNLSEAPLFAYTVGLGVQVHVWLRNVTKAGVAQLVPTGGTNGKSATTGKIGNADLGPLIVEAQNLANSAIPTKMGVAKFETITVRGTGLNGSNPGPGQMFINATHMGDTLDRGLTVRVFNRATHVQADDVRHWDTYGGATGGGYAPQVDMANYLNSLGPDRLVMIASFDALSFDSPGDVLRLALKRLGASPAIDGARGADRFQYAFIGIPGLGQGNGIEMLKPPTPGLPPAEAACFWLDNTILGSGSTINGMTLLTGDYFVDGAVQARHLAAGSIAVGTAAIAAGAILNAMIADATIESAKIKTLSADKITAGSLAVGSWIASSNFQGNQSGWAIWGNGDAQFNNVTVRGTVYANAGAIGGIIITDTELRSSNWQNGAAGFLIRNSDGHIQANNVYLRGSISSGAFGEYAWPSDPGGLGFFLGYQGLLLGNPAQGRYFQVTNAGNVYTPRMVLEDGNAYFSGRLDAATGTFSGSMTADAVNAVNTINIAGGAVTLLSAPSGSGNAASVPCYINVPAGNTYSVVVIGYQQAWSAPNSSYPSGGTLSVSGPTGSAGVSYRGAVYAYTGESDSGPYGPIYAYDSVIIVHVMQLGPGFHAIYVNGMNGAPKTVVCLVSKR